MAEQEFTMECPSCGLAIAAPTAIAQERPVWDPEMGAFRVRIHIGPNDVEYHTHVATCQGPPIVHAYAAAGVTCCGRETGGPISRHDGYEGPRLLTTAADSEVTCVDCNRWLRPTNGRSGNAGDTPS